MAEKNYYDILGVNKKASEDDIKKAYRKLVRQYHPDVSDDPKADEKMGEINNAYETLKDSQKRGEYDAMLDNPFLRGGTDGFNGFGGGFSGFGGGQGFNQANMSQADIDEILRQLGGNRSNFGSMGGRGAGTSGFNFDDIFSAFGGGGFGGQTQSSKGEDQHADLSVDLSATYEGATQKITLRLPVQTATGVDYQNKTIEVKIPKGITEGQQIRLAKQGNPSPYGGENGDLYLKVKFSHPSHLRVEGKDVFQTVDIMPWEAVSGGQITVTTPTGKVNVNVPKNSRSGTNLRLKGKGIPAKDAGDLFLQLNIVLPPLADDEKMREEQLQTWQFLKDAYQGYEPNR